MSNEPRQDLKLVTNLDRAGIEGKLRRGAQAARRRGSPTWRRCSSGIEGMPRAQIEARVRNAIKWLADKPEHKRLAAQLELVEMNLKNLK